MIFRFFKRPFITTVLAALIGVPCNFVHAQTFKRYFEGHIVVKPNKERQVSFGTYVFAPNGSYYYGRFGDRVTIDGFGFERDMTERHWRIGEWSNEPPFSHKIVTIKDVDFADDKKIVTLLGALYGNLFEYSRPGKDFVHVLDHLLQRAFRGNDRKIRSLKTAILLESMHKIRALPNPYAFSEESSEAVKDLQRPDTIDLPLAEGDTWYKGVETFGL